ncbi:MAG: hypothetical protein ACYS4W_07230 [Planctomycetota bacterium]|jgi:hypothetical protein
MRPQEGRIVRGTALFAASILAVWALMASSLKAATLSVRADGTGDYPTIQGAIDAANNGDEVVLEPGTYSGAGNRNLDFRGKAITVRSMDPDDDSFMCETILDAQGEGLIARFVNNEGPQTVFAGFTLGAGDTSELVRGDPGFFEFSKEARPTTRRLRNKAAQPGGQALTSSDGQLVSSVVDSDSPGWIPPDGRVWNGFNPFHQPAHTTDYYGSGDVDNDGNLTGADIVLAQDMADGLESAVTRGDVDGDLDVDNSDVSLISAAVGGANLPAWWNSLTTTTQRNNWIDKCIFVEKTDEHWYDSDFFVCHHFAYQTFVHCAFLRGDFATESSEYDGGRTVFNVPVYFVTVSSPTNHAINGILVGEDPLNFDHWRFIEPQDDTDVHPGGWNMRYGSDVYMTAPNLYWNAEVMVRFNVDVGGWTLQGYSGNLVTARPAPAEDQPDNRPDLWNPRIISVGGSDKILYEKMREDMSRTTDIHLADLPFDDASTGVPLINDSQFSRLLDVTEIADGVVHLLWEGKDVFYRQCLYHGVLDPVSGAVGGITNVTGDLRLASTGRVVVAPGEEVHVFWFENLGFAGAYEFGIHWSKWTGASWQAPQKLTADAPQGTDADWLNRHFARYVFDTVVLDNGNIMLVWVEEVFPNHYLTQMVYDGTWTSSRIDSTGWDDSFRGVDLCKDSDGVVHLAYWRGDRQQSGGSEEGRGDMFHRTFDGIGWTSPTSLDNSGGTCCPHLAAAPHGLVYVVWERKEAECVVPIWSTFKNGKRYEAEQLSACSDANAWYPKAHVLSSRAPVFAWSRRCDELVTIETATIETIAGDCDVDWDVDANDLDLFASHWLDADCNGAAGDYSDWCSLTDVDRNGRVDFNDFAGLAANWLVGVERRITYEFWLDTDPGWTTEGQWAFGQPTGEGAINYGYPDPNCGYTGLNVYGVNLEGDYSTAVGGPYYLTGGPFDFRRATGVKLKFARWLNSDFGTYVGESVEVSNDGLNWNTVWESPLYSTITDSYWKLFEYDIGDTADDQQTVYVRWGYEVKRANAFSCSGWNVDDVRIGSIP